MTAATCPRAGKWIGGCRFEPRYEHDAARELTHRELMGTLFRDMPAALRAVRASTYIHDICVRCGRTVEPSVVHVEAHPATDADLGERGERV